MASKSKCPTRTVRVTTHTWGPWKRGLRPEDACPFRQRKCEKCGKVTRIYGNRGY